MIPISENEFSELAGILEKGFPYVKTPQAATDVNRLGYFYNKIFGILVDCRWCNRQRVFNGLKTWYEYQRNQPQQ